MNMKKGLMQKSREIVVRYTMVYCITYHTPVRPFSKLDCSTTKRVPLVSHTERHVFGKSSRRNIYNADF